MNNIIIKNIKKKKKITFSQVVRVNLWVININLASLILFNIHYILMQSVLITSVLICLFIGFRKFPFPHKKIMVDNILISPMIIQLQYLLPLLQVIKSKLTNGLKIVHVSLHWPPIQKQLLFSCLIKLVITTSKWWLTFTLINIIVH